MKTETTTRQVYRRNEDGTTTLLSIETIEAGVVPTEQDLIAEKEAALLAMYEELQALKNNK